MAGLPYWSHRLATARSSPSISTPSLSLLARYLLRLRSPSPLIARDRHRHQPLHKMLPSHHIDRPRVPAPHAAFVHQDPSSVILPIPPVPFKMSRSWLSLPLATLKTPFGDALIIAPILKLRGEGYCQVLYYIAFLSAHILWATLLRLVCELIATRDPTRTASLEERPVECYIINFIQDEEDIAASERAEEDYQESEDINAPYEELERVIAEDRCRHDQEAEQFLTANYYPEEDPRAEDEESARETCAARLAEEILAEADAEEEPAEDEDQAEDTDYRNTSPDASTAADEERSDLGLAGMPPMFDGDCAVAARFINDWDEWSSTLSVQFSQFQLCTIFLSLFRPPVDHWAEQRLLQIRQWQDEGMTDDDDALLEDIIGRFMEEFVPRDNAREEYVGDAAEDPENPEDWETVDDGESTTDDGEVPSPPSLCRDDSQDSEEEPGEAEEYGCQDEVDKYYHSDDTDTTPDEAGQQYVDYGKVPIPYDAERDYADAILGRTRTHLEERVHPTPRKQKKRKTRTAKTLRKKTVKRPTAKSPPTWESRYIRRFGKKRLQMLHQGGIPDYMIEEELLPKKPTMTPYDYEEGRFHNEWTGPETFGRPATEPMSWKGPNTFAAPAYQAAPADPTPASWGSAEADATQELDEPRHRSWIAEYNNDCDDLMPQAALPRADYQMPRADSPRAVPPRGRSPTVKPVYGSNVATYTPTTRYEPTVITVPETQRRAPTPSPSPISDAGFKQIQHHIISTDHGTYQVPILTPDELAEALEDTHIHAVQAAEEGEYLRAANLCQRAHLLAFPDQLPRQYEEKVLQTAVGKLEREMAHLAEEYERKTPLS
ncbi:hypothetical protein EDB86DRAFT_3199150 [Lactarius hatsudake]|nr:hypothetical protein EDB86DRAFT_3199150 [Lactarius hatsudake]